jgi:hypothetical protein
MSAERRDNGLGLGGEDGTYLFIYFISFNVREDGTVMG